MDINFLFRMFSRIVIFISLVESSTFNDKIVATKKNKVAKQILSGYSSETEQELWQSCFKSYPTFFTHARPCAGTTLCRCFHDKACCINITNTVPKLSGQIRHLSFKNCFGGHLRRTAFSNNLALNLTHLDLSRSSLKKIDKAAFSKLNNLKYLERLDLSSNGFTKIPSLCANFSDFSGLKWLNFHKNTIGSIPKGEFDCFDNITDLNLGKNQISNFDIDLFVKLKKLKVLDLHSNWISSYNVTVLHGELKSLKELNLSKNELGIWPPGLCNGSFGPFPNLENLNLAENLITIPWNSTWSCLKNLKLLNLTRNPVRFLLENTFSELDSLEKLLLNDIFFSIEVFKETALNNSNMWMLTLSSNKMDFKKKESFRNIFHHSSNLSVLHLSGNNFKGIDGIIQRTVHPLNKTLQNLYLNNCNLTTIPPNLTLLLPRLHTLEMNHNQIQGFTSEDFQNATELAKLSLADNKIHKFDPKSLAGIVNRNLKNLDLSGNPLDCSCDEKNENKMREDIREFEENAYIGKAKLTDWPQGYKCDSPPKRVGWVFKDFNVDEMCPETNWLMIILLGFGSFLFIMAVISVLVYKYIWYIKYWLFKAKKRLRIRSNIDSERHYLLDNTNQTYKDVYIINHGNEDLFVLTDLRSIIEQEMGYSSCIYHRDCCNGVQLELMVESVYQCRHSLAVVSRSFIKDPWCLFQLDVAFDRRVEDRSRKLMLVIYDDIDFQVLNKYWCVMLTKTPKAQWCAKGGENYDILNKLFKQEIEKQLGFPGNRRRDRRLTV